MCSATVLLTDHAWPDTEIERAVIEAAGHTLHAPFAQATREQVEAITADLQPAAILTCWAPVSGVAIASTSALRVVGRMGVGLDNIDVAEATRRGIWVTNVPDYCVEEVSDHAIALMLGWVRGVVPLDRAVHAGRWDPSRARLARVATLTVGILGYGRIGRRTASKLAGLDVQVLALRPRTREAAAGAARLVDLDTLLAESDVLILHLPLTEQTQHIVDAAFLARVRRGAVLVNVSRGGLVDTDALIDALDRGQLAAAALDVLESEPHPPARLVARDDVILTPHVGFSSTTSVAELRRRASQEVVRVLAGETPLHACNTVSSGVV